MTDNISRVDDPDNAGNKMFTIRDGSGENVMARMGTVENRPFAWFFPTNGTKVRIEEAPDGSLSMVISCGNDLPMLTFTLTTDRIVSITAGELQHGVDDPLAMFYLRLPKDASPVAVDSESQEGSGGDDCGE